VRDSSRDKSPYFTNMATYRTRLLCLQQSNTHEQGYSIGAQTK
jgi:hypothetical protein